MKAVAVSPAAADFIRKEARYLKERNPLAAQNFLDDIRRIKRQLSLFPESGPLNTFPGYTGSRKIVMGNHVVMYDVRDKIIILHLRHGRQLDTLLAPDDPDPEVMLD
jgi:plasmid stabilization system protein ParE